MYGKFGKVFFFEGTGIVIEKIVDSDYVVSGGQELFRKM
jgi:hypothetical protein